MLRVRGRVWWPVPLLEQLLWHMLQLYKEDHASADPWLCCSDVTSAHLKYAAEGAALAPQLYSLRVCVPVRATEALSAH